MIDVSGYLRRICHRGPVRPDAVTLVALHRAHLATVPYENLDIQLGRPLSLAPEALYDKIVRRRRGGFCFELNGAFGLLLAAIGFPVRHVAGALHRDRHGEEAWGNHLALLVGTGTGSFLADVGFGDGFLAPLPLAVGSYPQGPLTYGLRRDLAGHWRMVHHPSGGCAGFEFRTDRQVLADFAPYCDRLSRAPDSPFVRTLLVQQPRADHALVLQARSLTRRGPAGRQVRELTDRAELVAVLAGEFGVPVAELGDPALDRLWWLSGRQQTAWQRAQERQP